jgi:adenylate kinase
MLVALTGTPGTGKTSVATCLQKKGYTIVRLNDLAIKQGYIDGVDKTRNTKLIDIQQLNLFIQKNYTTHDIVFFEGHAAHLLRAIDKVIILRCHPKKLKKRLQKKGWKPGKIKENIEAEILDIILCEAVDLHQKKNIFEIDTTNKTIDDVAVLLHNIVKKNFEPTKPYRIGQIDWSEEILKEYP